MTFTTRTHLSRRTLLRQGGIALSLPWLEAMQAAFAADPVPPRRFLCIGNYFSYHAPHFFPKEAGSDYAPSTYLEIIKAHRKDFTVISGLNHPDVRDGHNSDKSFLTGAPHPSSPSFRNSISMDQLLAERIGAETRFPFLTMSPGTGASFSYTRSGVAVPAESSAAKTFAQLFINGSPAEVKTEVQRIQEGRSILDRVGAEARAMQRTLGSADREKLDQYFTSVRELEQRMAASQDYALKPKPNPGVPLMKDPSLDERTVIFGLMLELARLAFQTDLTRIATLYFMGTIKTPSKPAESYAYHDLSHHGQDGTKIEKLALLERDIFKQLGGYLGKMGQADASGRRLLDSTTTVLGAGMGNASSHDATNLPILVAGGGFKHGSHIAHDPVNPPPLCNLWVQIMRQMGQDIDSFGTSKGTHIPGLND